jgi:hypothetical protein
VGKFKKIALFCNQPGNYLGLVCFVVANSSVRGLRASSASRYARPRLPEPESLGVFSDCLRCLRTLFAPTGTPSFAPLFIPSIISIPFGRVAAVGLCEHTSLTVTKPFGPRSALPLLEDGEGGALSSLVMDSVGLGAATTDGRCANIIASPDFRAAAGPATPAWRNFEAVRTIV